MDKIQVAVVSAQSELESTAGQFPSKGLTLSQLDQTLACDSPGPSLSPASGSQRPEDQTSQQETGTMRVSQESRTNHDLKMSVPEGRRETKVNLGGGVILFSFFERRVIPRTWHTESCWGTREGAGFSCISMQKRSTQRKGGACTFNSEPCLRFESWGQGLASPP